MHRFFLPFGASERTGIHSYAARDARRRRDGRRRVCALRARGAKMSISGGRPPRWKKSPKIVKNRRFLLKKWRILHKIWGGLHENECFFASIAPRLTRGCPCGKNPPIYTVLNAAFSAPTPPAGGTVVEIHLPTGPPPLPEQIRHPRIPALPKWGVFYE